MSIAIAVIYSAAAFTGIILWLQTRLPTGDLIAGIAGVGVIMIGGISLILAIIGEIMGAVPCRKRRMRQ
jgi:divalent metal cation (Fe/Co/Zn/Cd) transporter